jgi:hypothetical protein
MYSPGPEADTTGSNSLPTFLQQVYSLVEKTKYSVALRIFEKYDKHKTSTKTTAA